MRPVNRLVALILSLLAALTIPCVLGEDQSSEIAVRTLRGKELAPPSYMKRSRYVSHHATEPYRIRYVSAQVPNPWSDAADALIDEESALRREFLRRLLLRA